MNTRKMFARVGNECCHCGSVASANTNFQFAYAKATAVALCALAVKPADKLEIGNIGIGNIFTLATLSKLFCVAGLLLLGGCTLERYDYEMSREPYERPSVVTDDFREDNHVQPCFIVTTMCWEKFAHPGDQYMGPIGLFVLWGHLLGDTSF